MNNCEKCGNQVPEEKAFCPNCGAAMTPERERTTQTEEGMGETMYEFEPPSRILQAPMVPMPADEAQPFKAEPAPKSPAPMPKATQSSAPPAAAERSVREPSVAAYADSTAAVKQTPAADSNRKLRLILGASAALFALSILVIAILYIIGKI
ncbi:MAG TPA: zinc-ribbon domain-containing protein [Pyrinomonadaceae bacterium]|jgi:hypothetical protein